MSLLKNIFWANLSWLPILIAFVIAITVISLYQYKQKIKLINFLSNFKYNPTVWQNISITKEMLKTISMVLAFLFLALVLARPQKSKKVQDKMIDARDLVIALDISRSMLAQDVKPSRLEVAKSKIREILKYLPTDRVGLIVFSGSAFVQTPITKDIETFLLFLDSVDTETISSGTTNIASAIDKAIEQFKKIESDKKTLLLLTDGEDFVGNGQMLQDKVMHEKLTLVILGVGTAQGAPIPIFNEQKQIDGYQKDKDSNVVISKLNADFLQRLAKNSLGIYTLVSNDKEDVFKVVNFLEKIDAKRRTTQRYKMTQEKYHIFGFLAFLFLLINWLL